MSDFKFLIVKNLGVLAEGKEGWKKGVNLVSWNERKPKLDIREWDETHMRMKKGITFSPNEIRELKSILSELKDDCLELEI